MDYGLLEFLQGIQIKSNPNAAFQVFIFIVLISILVLVVAVLNKLPEIKQVLRDEQLYKFIMDFKNIGEDNRLLVKELIKKYNIRSKYKFIMIESIFEKYINKEMMSIENSSMDVAEKKSKLEELKSLKNILFR